MSHAYPRLPIDQPAVYRILVQGWLSEGWEDWFEGLRLTHLGLGDEAHLSGTGEPPPAETTLLTGVVRDQAALLGTLQKLYSFGLPILNVQFVSLYNQDRL